MDNPMDSPHTTLAQRLLARWPRIGLWLYAKWLQFAGRYRRAVTINSYILLGILVRKQFELPLPTDDEEVDSDLDDFVWAFLVGDTTPQTDAANKYHQWLGRNEDAMNVLREWLRVQHWFYSYGVFAAARNHKDTILRRYETLFGASLEPLEADQVQRYAKELKARSRQAVGALQETKARKVDLSKIDLRNLFPQPLPWVLTTAFVFSGYLYASTYFAQFNVDASQYFAVQDYLAYSIDKIGRLLFAPLGYILGRLYYHVRTPTLPRKVQERDMRQGRIWLRAMLTTLVLSSPIMVIIRPSDFYSFHVPMISLFVLLYVEHRVIPNYFVNYGNHSAVVSILMFLLILIWGSAIGDAHRAMDSMPQPFFVETTERRYDESSHRILGGNTGYVFLLGGDEQVAIIPRPTVKSTQIEAQESVMMRIRRWVQDKLGINLDESGRNSGNSRNGHLVRLRESWGFRASRLVEA